MTLQLPSAETPEAYRQALADRDLWRRAAALACDRHGLDQREIEPFDGGSSPVLAIGDALVIKFIARRYHDEVVAETAMLERLSGQLSVTIPELVATGDLDGWDYLIMTRVAGQPLSALWSELDGAARADICAQIGAGLAELHELPVGDTRPRVESWPEFLHAQRTSARTRQLDWGVEPAIADDIPALFAAVSIGARDRLVLAHGDLHGEHVYLDRVGDRWRVSGWIDFADALIAEPEYDLLTPGLLTIRGDAACLRAMLCGYGYAPEQLDSALRDRLMAFTLLHRFGDLPRLCGFVPDAPPVDCLADIADLLWPVAN